MFDGLKDKLNSFKENVEEEAEPAEEAADADAETEPADADQPAEREEPVEGEPETEPEPEADADDGGSDRGLMERAKLAATGKEVIEEDDLEGPLEELELALLSSDVEMSVAQEILRGIRENLIGETRSKVKTTGLVVEEALRDALIDVISVGQFDFEQRIAEADKPVSIIFTGVNGVGKTTTIAKLSQWLDERGYSTVLANGDTYRAGANEQLQQHADALDERLISHEQGSDPAAVIYDAVEYAEANDVDVVLGDTAGRLHTSNDLMDQLEKIDRVIEPDMTIFVDEAVAGQDAVNRAREFDDAAAIDGAVLTKADADPQGGAAISIAQVTGKPILFLGTGQDYDDLEPFDPEVIVDRLLGHDEEEPGPDEAAA
ncbi:signal recognition particle-docking protein FtsY [Halorientalis pallida]|uniref:signal recognition particle-docking protein FtsY n=1 Tax=Halorientalis pallida TaxID=2479928 RepID=UPI003C7000CE